MEVKFDLVRIGSVRKNYHSEKILKNNTTRLINDIRELLKYEICRHKNNKEHVTMIIPERGYSIKVLLKDFKDTHIRKIVRVNLPSAIYKGKEEKILDNMHNKVFK